MSTSLVGAEVWVTRAPEDAATLIEGFEAHGAQVRVVPCLERGSPDDEGPARTAWARIESYDRVLVGSPHALELFLRWTPPSSPAPVTAVGAKTAAKIEAFRRGHFELREVATTRRAEGIVECLVDALGRDGRLDGRRFLWPRPPEGRPVLADLLTARGASVDAVYSYRLRCPAAPSEAQPMPAVLTFMSGRTLACFIEMWGPRARLMLASAVVAVVGPVAAEQARALDVRVDVVPEVASSEALVGAVANYLSSRR